MENSWKVKEINFFKVFECVGNKLKQFKVNIEKKNSINVITLLSLEVQFPRNYGSFNVCIGKIVANLQREISDLKMHTK